MNIPMDIAVASSSSLRSSSSPTDWITAAQHYERSDCLVFGYLRRSINEPNTNALILNDIKALCEAYLGEIDILSADIQKSLHSHKIAVLGAGTVGLTSILLRLINNEFKKEYDLTIEDTYQYTMEVDGNDNYLTILDTAGQDEFRPIWSDWIRNNDAFMVVYSVSSTRTFKHAQDLYAAIKKEKNQLNEPIVCILVANKIDLPQSVHLVSYDTGKNLADQLNIPFIQTSAKNDKNIRQIFEILIRNNIKSKQNKFKQKCNEQLVDIINQNDIKYKSCCKIL